MNETLNLVVEVCASPDKRWTLVSKHRDKVADILGVRTAALQEQELRAKLAQEIVEDLAQSLLNPVLSKHGDDFKKIRLNVKQKGERVSVTVSEQLYKQMTDSMGRSAAKAKIDEIVDRCPEDVPNRSSWLNNEIKNLMVVSEFSTSLTKH